MKRRLNMPHKEMCGLTNKEDLKNVLALGLYTPSQSIATAELRVDSLQHIVGILAHSKFPCDRNSLLHCAKLRNAESEVIEFIQHLPERTYPDISSIISAVISEKMNSISSSICLSPCYSLHQEKKRMRKRKVNTHHVKASAHADHSNSRFGNPY